MDLSPLLKESIHILAAKRALLAANPNIKTLAVGSSHGAFAFNPAWCEGAFNMCCRSQDLKHSFHLYQKLTKEKPGIRNVVIFYSIFSPDSFMEKSPSESDISVALNEIFGLNIEYTDARLLQLQKEVKGKLGKLAPKVEEGVNGFFPTLGNGFFPESYGAVRRAKDHLRLNGGDSAHIYLTQLLRMARANGHNAYVVITPVRSDYRAATGDKDVLFAALKTLLEECGSDYKIPLLDLFDSTLFQDADFADFDHLLPTGRGVEILTRQVEAMVNS